MLAKLKVLLRLADNTQDVLLQALIDQAEAEFLAITHRSTLPTAAERVVVRMAMVRYNLIATEGLSSQTIDQIAEGFGGYDADLTKAIYSFRKVVIV